MIVRDVPVNDLIESLAAELKNVKDIAPPSWAPYVKTGVHKERPPSRDDWWYVRVAAVLRSVEKLGPVGVSKLRTKYGGRKNRGYAPERFYHASGNILRKALQQLEAAGLVKKAEKGSHKGRIITPAGNKLLRSAAREARRLYSKKQAEEKKDEKAAPAKGEEQQKTEPAKQGNEERTAKPAAEKQAGEPQQGKQAGSETENKKAKQDKPAEKPESKK